MPSDEFLVQKVIHQGSLLNPLIYIVVLKVALREMKSSCLEELFYADDQLRV